MLLSAAEPPPAVVGSAAVAASPVTPIAKAEPDTEVSGIVVSPPKPAVQPAWAAKFNLDPRGVYQQSDTPYLLRVRWTAASPWPAALSRGGSAGRGSPVASSV